MTSILSLYGDKRVRRHRCYRTKIISVDILGETKFGRRREMGIFEQSLDCYVVGGLQRSSLLKKMSNSVSQGRLRTVPKGTSKSANY